MDNGFQIVCWVLCSLYILITLWTVGKLVHFYTHDKLDLLDLFERKQYQIFLLTCLLSGTRAGYMILAEYGWDSASGVIKKQVTLFHFLDHTAVIIFCILSTVLASFWVRVFYTLQDKEVYATILEKVLIWCTAAYSSVAVVLLGLSFSSGTTDQTTMSDRYSLFLGIVMMCIAIVFLVYMIMASVELNEKVNLQVAQGLWLNRLRLCSGLCVIAFIVRGSLVFVTDKEEIQNNASDIALFAMYFVGLELIPMICLVIVYGQDPSGHDYTADSDSGDSDVEVNRTVTSELGYESDGKPYSEVKFKRSIEYEAISFTNTPSEDMDYHMRIVVRNNRWF